MSLRTPMRRRATGPLVLVLTAAAWPCLAQGTGEPLPEPVAPPAAEEPAADPKQPAGILPVADYSGDFWRRAYLTGDWGGTRTELANKGVQFDLRWNQYVQGVASGGRDSSTRYGGNGDYLKDVNTRFEKILSGAV